MSIFDPSTWFLHSMHQRGEEIAELVSEYVRQMTVLQVTVLYYNCLMLYEIDNALESQLKTVITLEQTAKVFRKESLEKIVPKLILKQWAFDVDILYNAKKSNLSIKEHKTYWQDRVGSKLDIKKACINFFLSILELRLLNSPFRSLV